MGVKILLILVLIVLITGCSEKTKPVVTDLGEEAVAQENHVQQNDVSTEAVPEPIVQINDTVIVDDEINVSEQINESDSGPGEHIIVINDLKYDQQTLTISQGDTVMWKNQDTWSNDGETKHYIAAHSNEFRSSVMPYGGTFSHTFNNTGTFTYIDVIYKDRASMRGTIIVE
ncbi:MAG: hypothetical protein KKC75_00840 [Nanoarchaeota archaeon]|nr:hypothetical protein [Nanoarchaeota archaeon]MBU1005661.1 hypothetical protein [Nanoarchaeota archaeon]MBU1946914.1 hypothetical protein [Nanoarchaeota archaeon]